MGVRMTTRAGGNAREITPSPRYSGERAGVRGSGQLGSYFVSVARGVRRCQKRIFSGPTVPIAADFDSCHTVPMLTRPQGVRTRLDTGDGGVRVTLLEPGVA